MALRFSFWNCVRRAAAGAEQGRGRLAIDVIIFQQAPDADQEMQSLCWLRDRGLSSHLAETKLKNNYEEQHFLWKCVMPCIVFP